MQFTQSIDYDLSLSFDSFTFFYTQADCFRLGAPHICHSFFTPYHVTFNFPASLIANYFIQYLYKIFPPYDEFMMFKLDCNNPQNLQQHVILMNKHT